MAEEARKFAPDVVFVDTYKLFEGPDGGYARSFPDATGQVEQMRISDGVHFTVDGAQYLSDVVWKLLDKRWKITEQAVPSEPIEYTIAEGSNYYVPGIGHYRPPVHDYSSDTTPATAPSSDTTPATTPATSPPTTAKRPPPSTPPTTKTTSPPPKVTVPHPPTTI